MYIYIICKHSLLFRGTKLISRRFTVLFMLIEYVPNVYVINRKYVWFNRNADAA